MIWWWAPIAQAEPEEPAEPEPVEEGREVEIAPAEALPSALDDLGTSHREVTLEEAPRLEDWVPRPGALLRGRWFAKPLLGYTSLPGDTGGGGVRLGAALGHQWWTLDSQELQIGGESRVEVTAPIGGLRGRRVEMSTVAGPWLGPVGPAARRAMASWTWSPATSGACGSARTWARASRAASRCWIGTRGITRWRISTATGGSTWSSARRRSRGSGTAAWSTAAASAPPRRRACSAAPLSAR